MTTVLSDMAKRIILVDSSKVKKKNTPDFGFIKETKVTARENRLAEEKKDIAPLELRILKEKILTIKKINSSGGYTHYTRRLIDEDQEAIYLINSNVKLLFSDNQGDKQIHLDYLKTTSLVKRIGKKDIRKYFLTE